MILNQNGVELDQQKHWDIDIFRRKIINFCISNIKSEKNFRLAAGPLPGVALGGEQPPAARCAGAKRRDFGFVFDPI